VPTLVEGSVEVKIVSGEGVIVVGGTVGATTMVALVEVTWVGLLLSVTLAVKVEVPLAFGTPEIAPLDGDRLRPAGRLPEMIAQV
jgi:hypothetical protein